MENENVVQIKGLKEFIKITFELESKSVYTLKGIGYYWMNEKTLEKNSKLLANFQIFPNSYMVETGLRPVPIYSPLLRTSRIQQKELYCLLDLQLWLIGLRHILAGRVS